MARRASKDELYVTNPAPIWRRCLTESAMPRKPTTTDWIIVGLFLAALAGMVVAVLLR